MRIFSQQQCIYHIQNINDIDEWDYLWFNLTENRYITSQQRSVSLRALSAAKEIWRLKSYIHVFSPVYRSFFFENLI